MKFIASMRILDDGGCGSGRVDYDYINLLWENINVIMNNA